MPWGATPSFPEDEDVVEEAGLDEVVVEGAELEALGEEESVLADSSVFLLQLESVRTAHIASAATPKRENVREFIPHLFKSKRNFTSNARKATA